MARSLSYIYAPYGSIPHGSEDITLSDTVVHYGVQGFLVDADGTLAMTFADGNSAAWVVKAGVQYAGHVTKFKATGSTGVTTVSVLY